MPGTPATSPNFGAPRFDDSDPLSFSEQVNSVTDHLDAYLANLVHQPGDVIISAAASRPGCLLCNGDSSHNASDYPALAAVIGSGSSGVYGAAPTGKLKLPDYVGRVIVGAGQGAGLTNRLLGAYGGEETHPLSIAELAAHAHGVNDPGHTHNVFDPGHAHAVADPGHGHGVQIDSQLSGIAPTSSSGWSDMSTAGGSLHYAAGSNGGTVGSQGLAHYHDVSIMAAGTGVRVAGATTGVGIYGAGTGIGIQNAGSGQGHNNVQPFGTANVFIKV